MPEPRRSRDQLPATKTLALGCAFLVCLQSLAAAQSPQSKSAGDIFPLRTAWMVTLDAPPALPPAYDDARAYVALRPDPDRGYPANRIVALSLTDGSTKWSREVAGVDALAVGDDLVFACSGSLLQALETSDGRPRWQLPLDAPLSAPLHHDHGWLIAVTQGSQAFAIRARDGEKVWQVHLPSPAVGEPALSGDELYLPLTDSRVVRLKLETAAVIWDQKILSQPTSILALDDRVFVGTRERWFYALHPGSGRVLWRVRVGSAVVGVPAADRSAVYFLAFDNLLRALDRSGGSLKWRQLLVRRAGFGPFRMDTLLFVSGPSPTIQAYDTNGGTSAGSFDAPHDLFAPVHVMPGLVDRDFLLVALTGEGELLAIRPQSLEPEPFAISPLVCLSLGFPRWRY